MILIRLSANYYRQAEKDIQSTRVILMEEDWQMEEKPTFMQLRRTYNQHTNNPLTSQQLAEATGIPLADVYQMEVGGWVSKQNAIKILEAFFSKTGKRYTLNDISVHLKTSRAGDRGGGTNMSDPQRRII